MKTPPLPPKWSYKKPFLKDEEGYERYVLDKSGKLDRLYVASVLEKYGHSGHAAAWRGQELTPLQLAAPELLAACIDLINHLETLPTDTEKCRILKMALNNRSGDLIRAAVAKATA